MLFNHIVHTDNKISNALFLFVSLLNSYSFPSYKVGYSKSI